MRQAIPVVHAQPNGFDGNQYDLKWPPQIGQLCKVD
jgi:hypothetical protein